MPIVPRSTCATGASAWSRRRSAQRTPTARREKCVRTASVQRQHSGVRATLTARQVKCAQPGGAFRPQVEFSGSSTHPRGCSHVRARPCPSSFSVAEGIRTGSGEPHSVQRCVGLMCSTPSRPHPHPLRQRGLKLATTENGSIRLLDRLLVDHLAHLRARLEKRPCSEYIPREYEQGVLSPRWQVTICELERPEGWESRRNPRFPFGSGGFIR